MKRLPVVLLALAGAILASAQNPHDGYAFWLPCGELKVGDAASEKAMGVQREGASLHLTLKPRRTRFDVPAGQFVVAMPTSWPGNRGMKRWPQFKLQGGASGSLVPVTYLPKSATKDGAVAFQITPIPNAGTTLRFYWTDDSDHIGADLSQAFWGPGASGDDDAFLAATIDLTEGRRDQAKRRYLNLSTKFKGSEAQRLCRRMARWCDAESALARIKTGQGFYNLGLYCMVNGFWDAAAASLKRATDLMPKNPDAWSLYADALSYQQSDLDRNMEKVYPFYRRAADLYPREGANTFRTFIGFFKNLRVRDGDGTRVLHMTQEQMDYAKTAWEWCSAIMESASKGRLRMVNTYKVYDEEFDSTDDWYAKPFEGLFERGSQESFMKMTGWGASACCGMDCGPNRSAFINMGIREWDVMLHEWNHSLDWAMISGELGIGVPETHSSDWCGYQPISSMGMGHHSCNRYYMTPGMYQFVRGSDPITTPHLTDWTMLSEPIELLPEVSAATIADASKMDPFVSLARAKTTEPQPPVRSETQARPKIVDGYVDLKATWPNAPKNAYAFAETYVYSPERQKVRMWVGADDNLRMWLNGRLIHKGLYWSCALFTEVKEKDQVAKGVLLERGWNRLAVQVTNVQRAPDWLGGNPPDCWGFSVRICDSQNRTVPGLRISATAPRGAIATSQPIRADAPQTFRWSDVRDDYTVLLPELSLEDLRAVTGYQSLEASNEVLFSLRDEPWTVGQGSVLDKPNPTVVRLDNQVNWFFSPKEAAGVVRYRRGSQRRDLLFLRPEGYEAFLNLMPVSSEAKTAGIKSHAEQVIGYFLAKRPDSPNGRILLVVDTVLPARLPIDEEDLLSVSELR